MAVSSVQQSSNNNYNNNNNSQVNNPNNQQGYNNNSEKNPSQNDSYDDARKFINLYLGGVKVTPQDMLELYEKLLGNSKLSEADQQQFMFLQAQISSMVDQQGTLNLTNIDIILDSLQSEIVRFQQYNDLTSKESSFSKGLLSEIQDMKSIYREFFNEKLENELSSLSPAQKNEFNEIFKEKIGQSIFAESEVNLSNAIDATTQAKLAQTLSQEGYITPNSNTTSNKNDKAKAGKSSKNKKEIKGVGSSATLGATASSASGLDTDVIGDTSSVMPSYLTVNQGFGLNLAASSSTSYPLSGIGMGTLDGLTRAALVMILVASNSANALNDFSNRIYSVSNATQSLNSIMDAFQQLTDFYTLNGGTKSMPISLFKELQLYMYNQTQYEGKYQYTVPGFANQCSGLLQLLKNNLDGVTIPGPTQTLDSGQQNAIMQNIISNFNSTANYVNGDVSGTSLFNPGTWTNEKGSPFFDTGLSGGTSKFIFTRAAVNTYVGQQNTGSSGTGIVAGLSQIVTSATSTNQTQLAKQNLQTQGATQLFATAQSVISQIGKLTQ
jgi:hypothetical protein